MLTVDDRCTFPKCGHREGMYRMIGTCGNCRTENILVLFTSGHESRKVKCPVCRCDAVYVTRLATEDEIPAAEPFPC